MLQARLRGSKEWYRPDRDFMVAHPRLLSQAFAALTAELETDKALTQEGREDDIKRLGALATGMAKLHNSCGNREVSADEVKDRLMELGIQYPYLSLKLADYVMRISFEMYRHWKLETLPENPDGTVDHTKLALPLQVQPAPTPEGSK